MAHDIVAAVAKDISTTTTTTTAAAAAAAANNVVYNQYDVCKTLQAKIICNNNTSAVTVTTVPVIMFAVSCCLSVC